MIKKAVVAAAGQGTRMLHLTKNKSKHLIKVNDKPFLAYVLDNLFRAGYREIILVCGYKEELIKDFTKNYVPPVDCDFEIKLISQFDRLGPKEKIYGTACPLMCIKEEVGKDDFLFICGDNLYSVKDLQEMAKTDNYSYVAGLIHENPEKYGVLITDDGFLKEIKEKPKKYVGNLINTGIYKFTSDVFEKLPKIKKSSRGEYEITDVITLLAKEKKVKVIRIDDHWLDFGSPGDIIKLSRFLKNENNKAFKG